MSKALKPEAIADALEYAENYRSVSSEQHLNTTAGRFFASAIAALEAIGRVRELAEKLRDWKGALDPIGPLHGVGLTLGQNLAGEAILAAIDGEEKP